MSYYEENIKAFIQVLETRFDIVSLYKDDLEDLKTHLPDKIDKLSIEIARWYKQRTPIRDAVKALLKSSGASKQKGFTNDISSPSPEDYKTLVEKTIQNVIRLPPKSDPPPQSIA